MAAGASGGYYFQLMKKVIYLTALGRAYARSGLEAGADILRLITSVNSVSGELGWKASAIARTEKPRIFTGHQSLPGEGLAPTAMFAGGLKSLKARLDYGGIVRSYRRKLEEYSDELEGADLLHAWDAASVLALRALPGPAGRRPLLFTPEAGYPGPRPEWLDSLRRRALEAADALVLPGAWAAAGLEAEYRHGKKCLELPRGLEDFKYLRSGRVRAELGVKGEELLICSFGRLSAEKGFSVLLDAMALVEKELPGRFFCAIAGAGPEEDRLKARLAALGLEGRARVLGYREDAGELLADADIFAMPSLTTASEQGLLEAMRAGLAIVASDAGGNPELLDWGEAGLLAPAGDPAALARALLGIARDPLELVSLPSRARTCFVKKHTLKALAANAAALYDRIVAGAGEMKEKEKTNGGAR